MADYSSSLWNQEDNLNTAATPDGMPAGTPASALYGIMRAMKGAAKREYDRTHATRSTGGTTTAYTITHDKYTSYVLGDTFRVTVNATNTGAATVNVNALGAKNIITNNGAALTAGQIVANSVITLHYNGTSFVMETTPADTITAGGSQTLNNKIIVDSTNSFVDNADQSKRMQLELSGVSAATTRTLTVPNVNGVIATTNNAQTFTGVQTFSSAPSMSSGIDVPGGALNMTGAGAAIELGRLDGTAATPYIDFHSGTTPIDYDARIVASGGTGSIGGGTLTFNAGNLTWGGTQLVNLSSAQTLTNKTITGGTINGTIAGNPVYTGLQAITASNSTTQTEYLRLAPSDFGTGKPYLVFQKGTGATQWNIGIYDGVSNTGIINLNSSSVTKNGVEIADISSAQTLTNKTLTSPAINTPTISGNVAGTLTFTGVPSAPTAAGGTNTTQIATTAFVTSAVGSSGAVLTTGNQTVLGQKTFGSPLKSSPSTSTTLQTYLDLSPTDVGTGKPAFQVFKDSTANRWIVRTYDGTNTSGTIDVQTTNLNHNGYRVYAQSTILGPVSQSGGIPTGNIIETGQTSITNQYTKMTDGTLYCYGSFQLTYSIGARLDNTLTFPTNMFSNQYRVFLTLRPNNNAQTPSNVSLNCTPTTRELLAPIAGGYLNTGFTGALYTVTGSNFVSGDYVYVDYFAVGRWL